MSAAIRTLMRLLLALAMLVAALAIHQPAHADSSSAPPVASTSGTLTSGADLYTHICQGCHMPDGQGAKGAGFYPALGGDVTLASAQYPALIVLNGRHGMPPFGLPEEQAQEIGGVHLSDAQIAAVVNYVRSALGNRYKDRITEQQVAALPHPGTPAP
ncbi:MAG: cytochrome c [Steroidobacteraceae bacterium]